LGLYLFPSGLEGFYISIEVILLLLVVFGLSLVSLACLIIETSLYELDCGLLPLLLAAFGLLKKLMTPGESLKSFAVFLSQF
jgi:hypothetical protein